MASYNNADVVNYKDIKPAKDDDCTSHNFIWENKGIALGIIHYILNIIGDLGHNPRKVKEAKKHLNIVIKIRRFRRIIHRLFPDIKISRKSIDNMNNIYVSIKTVNFQGLVINNLDNLKEINAENIYLLPCYDPDNPVVYFEYDSKKSIDVNTVREKVDTFTRCHRGRKHCTENYVTERCNLYTWDPCVEYKILRRYTKAYYLVHNDFPWVYNYVSKRTMDDYCPIKKKRKNVYVNVPIEVPVNVPVPVHVHHPHLADAEKDRLINELRQEINRLKAAIRPAPAPVPAPPVVPAPAPPVVPAPIPVTAPPVVRTIVREVKVVDHSMYIELIDALNDKIEVLNRMI